MHNSFSTAPSSPPTDIDIHQVTAVSFVVSWSAPLLQYQNGIIRHYNVQCTHHDGEMDTTTELLTDSSTEVLVENLHPFYNYTCSVAAVTVSQGPHSTTVLITTLEDGQLNFCTASQ